MEGFAVRSRQRLGVRGGRMSFSAWPLSIFCGLRTIVGGKRRPLEAPQTETRHATAAFSGWRYTALRRAKVLRPLSLYVKRRQVLPDERQPIASSGGYSADLVALRVSALETAASIK